MARIDPRKSKRRKDAVKNGWASGFEEDLASTLSSKGVPHEYEKLVIPYLQPAKTRKYTPDFVLLANGIIVESKGRFVTADRAKMLLIKQQHPDLDIRFVFSNSRNRISKISKTTYGMWAEAKGFPYADKAIPESWLRARPNQRSLAAIQALKERSK